MDRRLPASVGLAVRAVWGLVGVIGVAPLLLVSAALLGVALACAAPSSA